MEYEIPTPFGKNIITGNMKKGYVICFFLLSYCANAQHSLELNYGFTHYIIPQNVNYSSSSFAYSYTYKFLFAKFSYFNDNFLELDGNTSFGLVHSATGNIGITTKLDKRLVFQYCNGLGILGAANNNLNMESPHAQRIPTQFIFNNHNFSLTTQLTKNKRHYLGFNANMCLYKYYAKDKFEEFNSLNSDLIVRTMLSYRFVFKQKE